MSDRWQDKSICAGMDPDFFYPEKSSGEDVDRIAKFCALCPVRDNCLEYGLSLGDDRYGYFGGKSPSQRRKIRRKRSRDAREQAALSSRIESADREPIAVRPKWLALRDLANLMAQTEWD